MGQRAPAEAVNGEKFMNKKLGLYIHIPFCKSKCHYCDFNSQSGKEDLIEPYFNALQREIRNYSDGLKDCSVGSVFIGGGTPSLADAKYIYQLMNTCRLYFEIGGKAEITIESNPGTLTYEKLLSYGVNGINRLSIGLQACQDIHLKKLGRIHSAEDFRVNLEAAVKAGFRNINADLIFGIPGQNMNDWSETVKSIVRLGLQHISCYSLKIEEETPFYNMLRSGTLQPVDEELDRRMYRHAVDELKKHGYIHYEISNFALPGYECRHNLIYWKASEYLGIGAGAHSYMAGSRYNNICNIEEYIDIMLNGGSPVVDVQVIDKTGSMSEYMILGLRLVDGIGTGHFKERYGEDVFKVFGKQIDKLLKKQLLEREDDRLRLTAYGLDVANCVFEEFI